MPMRHSNLEPAVAFTYAGEIAELDPKHFNDGDIVFATDGVFHCASSQSWAEIGSGASSTFPTIEFIVPTMTIAVNSTNVDVSMHALNLDKLGLGASDYVDLKAGGAAVLRFPTPSSLTNFHTNYDAVFANIVCTGTLADFTASLRITDWEAWFGGNTPLLHGLAVVGPAGLADVLGGVSWVHTA